MLQSSSLNSRTIFLKKKKLPLDTFKPINKTNPHYTHKWKKFGRIDFEIYECKKEEEVPIERQKRALIE